MQVLKTYYVYLMASNSGTLYVGVTSSLKRRVYEHKTGAIAGFTSKYHVKKLVHVETFKTAEAAIRREKQIKSWRREKKVNLVDTENPAWDDLAVGWYANVEKED